MSGAISAVSAAGAAAAAAGAGEAGIAGAAISANAGLFGAASLATSALGSIAQSRAQSESSNYNAKIAANNAQIATQNATAAGQAGEAQAGAAALKTRAEVGSIKASQAANGIDVNSGSDVDVRSSASELGELNAITIRSNAAKTAYGFQTQAASDTAQSSLDRQQAQYATEAGDVKAGTTLLAGAAVGGQSGLWGNFLNGNSINSASADMQSASPVGASFMSQNYSQF